IARPEREQPPQMAQAYIQGMQIARQDLMSVTGQYQAELGMPSNERSGIAIQQRQRQGDTATYHYIDNQAKGIRQIGRILLDMIPKIYDVRRVVMTLAEDGDENKVLIDPQAPEAHQEVAQGPDGTPAPVTPGQAQRQQEDPERPDPTIIFNPNVGTYDVEADVGPSYGTQRQEAANAFSQIMSQNPAAFQIVGDFWATNSDFPGADELADRLKRGLPPQYKAGPDPQTAAITQHAQQLLSQADQEIAELKQQLAAAQMKSQDKSAEIAVRDYEAETKRLDVVGGIDPHSLQIIVRGLVEDMLGTRLQPVLEGHADVQGDLAARMAPPVPPNGADASGGAAEAPATVQ
ncbi:MAG TPA: portal protein, partial [Polyangia bacterium]|nr:portal protein [Polyangia bacterium]